MNFLSTCSDEELSSFFEEIKKKRESLKKSQKEPITTKIDIPTATVINHKTDADTYNKFRVIAFFKKLSTKELFKYLVNDYLERNRRMAKRVIDVSTIDTDNICTTNDISDYLEISPSNLYHVRYRYNLPFFYAHGLCLYRKEDVIEWNNTVSHKYNKTKSYGSDPTLF